MESISFEVMELIVAGLELESICNLRLTSKRLSTVAAGPTFLRYIARQTHLLDRAGLRTLNDISKHITLGPAVQDIVLLTSVYDSSVVQ